MSWAYLPDRVEDCLRANTYLASRQYAMWKLTLIALRCLRPESGMACLKILLSGMMCGRSMVNLGVERWISSQPDSHVSRGRSQESKGVSETTETSGRTPFALYKKCDPNMSFSKMSLGCSPQNPLLAYVAGLIDGEGHIGIQSSKGLHFSVEVTIGMSDKAKPVLMEMKKHFGGTVLRARKQTEKWAASTKWRIGGGAACTFLKKIKPFIVLKQKQIEIALSLESLIMSLQSQPSGRKIWTKRASQKAAEIKKEMHKVNQKGPDALSAEGGWYHPMPDIFGTWERFSETWPASGLMCDGVCYRLPDAERHISGRGSGYSRIEATYPTPNTLDGAGAGRANAGGNVKKWHGLNSLGALAAAGWWPTPAVQEPGWKHIEVVDKDGNFPEHPNQRFYDKETGRIVQKGLTQVVRMWRTPDAGSHGNVATPRKETLEGKTVSKGGHPIQVRLADQVVNPRLWPTPRANKVGGYSSERFRPTLEQEVLRWPTPKVRDYRKASGKENRDSPDLNVVVKSHGGTQTQPTQKGQLNPAWVEWLMGWPIGWTDLEPLEMGRFQQWQQKHGII